MINTTKTNRKVIQPVKIQALTGPKNVLLQIYTRQIHPNLLKRPNRRIKTAIRKETIIRQQAPFQVMICQPRLDTYRIAKRISNRMEQTTIIREAHPRLAKRTLIAIIFIMRIKEAARLHRIKLNDPKLMMRQQQMEIRQVKAIQQRAIPTTTTTVIIMSIHRARLQSGNRAEKEIEKESETEIEIEKRTEKGTRTRRNIAKESIRMKLAKCSINDRSQMKLKRNRAALHRSLHLQLQTAHHLPI